MIDTMPDEVIEEIAWYLDAKSLDSLEGTCRRIRNIQFGRHWKKIFISTIPEMDHLLYSTSSMKSLICTRKNLMQLKKEVIDLKKAVDVGEWCEFINVISLCSTMQAATFPLLLIVLSPFTFDQIRKFYERKRNTQNDGNPAT